jgi:hypothetical protein
MKSQAEFGSFELCPARYSLHEAWVLIDNKWLPFHPAEVINSARPMSEAEFSASFGQVPQLPTTAFSEEPEKPWLGFVGTLRLHWMRQALERGWDDERDRRTFGGMSEASVRSYVAHMKALGL